jgi:hypothetical protein
VHVCTLVWVHFSANVAGALRGLVAGCGTSANAQSPWYPGSKISRIPFPLCSRHCVYHLCVCSQAAHERP